MYRIIGADQKEYGPVTADQIRQWLAEGRANAQTMIRPEGEAEWRPISSFPEFAAAPTPAPPPPGASFPPAPLPQSFGSRASAEQAVKAPAIALLVTAILGLLLTAFGFIGNVLRLAGGSPAPPMPDTGDPQMNKLLESMAGSLGVIGLVQNIITAGMGVVILMGALKMMKLQNHKFAIIAAILAMIPCFWPCCILGLPFGIWALVVLNQPHVKSNFT